MAWSLPQPPLGARGQSWFTGGVAGGGDCAGALLVVALRRGMLAGDAMDRAWWTAVLMLVAMHATDLPFFDSRLNILGWVLLSGLWAFIREAEPDHDAHEASLDSVPS